MTLVNGFVTFSTLADLARQLTEMAEHLPPDTKVAFIDEHGSVTLSRVEVGRTPQKKQIVCVR